MIEVKPLSFGIFWVITESEDLDNYKLLYFNVPSDTCGNAIEAPIMQLNSKSGTSYNHKDLWDGHIKNNPSYKPYNRKEYNHYPRGRVEISNQKAVIYLNPIINLPRIMNDIKAEFGLTEYNIPKVRIVADNSTHYACFMN